MTQNQRSNGGDSVIPCRLHPSGFEKSDSNFYSLDVVSDGSLYFTLSCHNIDINARVYRYDPATDALTLVCDLGEATGELGKKMLPQGKSHSPFYELDGWLYLATHYGFFATTDQREELAAVPEGYTPYPGGHILRINMADGRVEDLARTESEEGILTLKMDAERRRLYGLTWPKGFFLVYDIDRGELRNLGQVSRGGEAGRGEDYFCLVRSLAVDPRDGHVYFTNADGAVQCYDPETDRVEPFGDVTLKRDILGQWDPHTPGHQGYNWRDILWHDASECFYGVHPRSGWLFRFDPPAETLELVERIVADDLWASGRFEPFRYGYLTLEMGLDGETLHYLTSTFGQKDENGHPIENQRTHLLTYNLRTRKRTDHGVLRLEDGRYVQMSQCHAVHPNGRCYACPWIETSRRSPKGRPIWQCDLISFANPLAQG